MCLSRVLGVLVGYLLVCQGVAEEHKTPQHVLIYNHPYSLELHENTSLTRQLRPAGGRLEGMHYHGKLTGHEDSWVRASIIDGSWQGIVSLSGQVYLIEAPVTQAEDHGNFTGHLPVSLPATPVSDYQPIACGCESPQRAKAIINPDIHSALEPPKAVQFSSLCETRVDGVCLLAEVEFVFDQAFQQRFSGDGRAEAESLINMAEGFFRNDLGVLFDTITLELPGTNVFDTTVVGDDLLADMRVKKFSNQLSFIKNNRALLHLVTGRDLTDDENDSGLAGIAYLNALCDQFGFSSGVSQVLNRFNGSPNLSLTALVIAHELGHNFGANHDVDDNSCGSGFIMEPTINSGANRFSSCSQEQMQSAISDLESPETCFNFPVDVSLTADPANPDKALADTAIDLEFEFMSSAAYRSIPSAVIEGNLGSVAEGRFTSVSLAGVPCTIAANGVSYECTITSPLIGEDLLVQIEVNSQLETHLDLTQVVSTSGDQELKDILPENNEVQTRIIIAPPVPDPPTLLNIEQTALGRIRITWTDNSYHEDGFRVERKLGDGEFVGLSTVGIDETEYVDTMVEPNQTYVYRILAFNEYGDSNDGPSGSIFVVGVPEPVENFTAVNMQRSVVLLSWESDDPSTSAYIIERREEGESAFLTVSDRAFGPYQDHTVTVGKSYEYRILSFNDFSESLPSDVVSIVVADLPNQPRRFNVSRDGDNIVLEWLDESDNESGFRLERNVDRGDFESLATLSANVSTYRDEGVEYNRLYSYRIAAINEEGESPFEYTTEIEVPGPLFKPTNLTLVQQGASQVVVSWEDTNDYELVVDVERRILNSGAYNHIARFDQANVTSYVDDSVVAGETYEYRILVQNRGAEPKYSDSASILVQGAPEKPSSISVSQGSGTQVSISWSDSSDNESGFRIERRIGGGAFSELATVGSNVTTYTDTTSNAGTNYGYQVVAYNNWGDSNPSNSASITPANPAPPPSPTPAPSGGGGGSTGWLWLVLMPLALFRKCKVPEVVL